MIVYQFFKIMFNACRGRDLNQCNVRNNKPMSMKKMPGTLKQRAKKLGKEMLSDLHKEDKREALITSIMKDKVME